MIKSLNRNELKYMAIIAMVIDHIATFFISSTDCTAAYVSFRIIGRLTAPIMCFFIAEGFYYTHSRLKYALRLGIFAVISQFTYTFANNGILFTWDWLMRWNVIFTLFIGFLVLYCYENVHNKFLKWTCIMLLLLLSIVGDWAVFAPIWILIFYTHRSDIKKELLYFNIVAVMEVLLSIVAMIVMNRHWYGELWQAGLFLFNLVIPMYNGQKGSSNIFHKWVFYIFYPLHFTIIGIIYYYLLKI